MKFQSGILWSVLFTLSGCASIPDKLVLKYRIESEKLQKIKCTTTILVIDQRRKKALVDGYSGTFRAENVELWLLDALKSRADYPQLLHLTTNKEERGSSDILLSIEKVSLEFMSSMMAGHVILRMEDKRSNSMWFRGYETKSNWATTQSEMLYILNRALDKSLQSAISNFQCLPKVNG